MVPRAPILVEAAPVGTAARVWVLDPAHTLVEFSVRHMMIATVKGRFRAVEGLVRFDAADPAGSTVSVRIAADTIDTGIPARDAHLRSADFFDVESHPRLEFVSRSVEGFTGGVGESFRVHGDLTVRGTTRPVTLQAVYGGRVVDPDGEVHLGFSAGTRVDRRAFGLTWNQALEAGGLLVGNDVNIELQVELTEAVSQEAG
ncbi:MAG: YceI family protein, partial [Longimicrobiales bacterium]